MHLILEVWRYWVERASYLLYKSLSNRTWLNLYWIAIIDYFQHIFHSQKFRERHRKIKSIKIKMSCAMINWTSTKILFDWYQILNRKNNFKLTLVKFCQIHPSASELVVLHHDIYLQWHQTWSRFLRPGPPCQWWAMLISVSPQRCWGHGLTAFLAWPTMNISELGHQFSGNGLSGPNYSMVPL